MDVIIGLDGQPEAYLFSDKEIENVYMARGLHLRWRNTKPKTIITVVRVHGHECIQEFYLKRGRYRNVGRVWDWRAYRHKAFATSAERVASHLMLLYGHEFVEHKWLKQYDYRTAN